MDDTDTWHRHDGLADKEHLVAVRPGDDALILETMYLADETARRARTWRRRPRTPASRAGSWTWPTAGRVAHGARAPQDYLDTTRPASRTSSSTSAKVRRWSSRRTAEVEHYPPDGGPRGVGGEDGAASLGTPRAAAPPSKARRARARPMPEIRRPIDRRPRNPCAGNGECRGRAGDGAAAGRGKAPAAERGGPGPERAVQGRPAGPGRGAGYPRPNQDVRSPSSSRLSGRPAAVGAHGRFPRNRRPAGRRLRVSAGGDRADSEGAVMPESAVIIAACAECRGIWSTATGPRSCTWTARGSRTTRLG